MPTPDLALNNVITQSELGPSSRLLNLRVCDALLARSPWQVQEQDVNVGPVIQIDAVPLKWLYTSSDSTGSLYTLSNVRYSEGYLEAKENRHVNVQPNR
jgi:hypothetical protein